MPELMTLEPREADRIVREPAVDFARGAADGDELHGAPCLCADIWTRDATYH